MRTLLALGKAGTAQGTIQTEPRVFSNHCPESPDTTGRDVLMLSPCQTTTRGSSGATTPPLLCPARLGQGSDSAPSAVTGHEMTEKWTGLGKRVSDSTAQ